MRTTGKATDLITFSRNSGGTALRKIAYGDELVTNGTFDSDINGWDDVAANAPSTTVTWNSGGYVDINSADVYDGIQQTITTKVGAIYTVSTDITLGTVSSARVYETQSVTSETTESSATIEFIFVATSASSVLRIDSDVSTGTFSIDNISVKEVLFDQGDLTLFNHPADIPRIEYDANGNFLGLLVEESRVNLVTYSEDFTNAAWPKTRSSITSNAVVAPDGTFTGDKFVEDTSGNSHYIRRTGFSSAQYAYSIYAKAAERTWFFIFTGAVGTNRTWFDLGNGVVGTSEAGNTNAKMEHVGNGWYRCSVVAAAGVEFGIQLATSDGNTVYAGDGTSGIYIWGAQVE